MRINFKDTWHVFQENSPCHFWGLNLWQVLLSLYANSAPLRSGFTVMDIFVVTVMLTLVKYLKLWLSTAHTHTLPKSFFPFFKMWPNVTAPMAAFQREVIIPQSWQCEEVNRDERGVIKVGLCNDFLLLQEGIRKSLWLWQKKWNKFKQSRCRSFVTGGKQVFAGTDLKCFQVCFP